MWTYVMENGYGTKFYASPIGGGILGCEKIAGRNSRYAPTKAEAVDEAKSLRELMLSTYKNIGTVVIPSISYSDDGVITIVPAKFRD